MARHDSYYDPDHLYRRHDRFNSGYGGSGYGRREFGPTYNNEPYDGPDYPSAAGRREEGFREYDRESRRHPSSWYSEERSARDHGPADEGYAWRVNHGYRGAGGYRSPPHDEAHVGAHVGRGPKGYVRSDERIREDVCDCLTYDPHIDARNLEVTVKGGEVTLDGKIDSRGARRHAEEIAERTMGVKHVQNNLRVADKPETPEASATPLFNRTASDKR